MKFSSVKFRAGALLIISLFFGLLFANVSEHKKAVSAPAPWTTVVMQSTGGQISFPTAPEHTVENISVPGSPDPTAEGIFVARAPHSTLYLLSVFTVPTVTSTDLFEYRLRHLLGAHASNQLVSMVSTTVSGTEARDFLVQNMDDGSYRQGRMARVGPHFYTWFVTYPNGQFPAVDYAHFINSFKIVAAP